MEANVRLLLRAVFVLGVTTLSSSASGNPTNSSNSSGVGVAKADVAAAKLSICESSPWLPQDPVICSCPDLPHASSMQRPPLDNTWMMFCAVSILGMQIGFALLEGGYTRKMHMANIMMKNIADMVLSGMGFFFIGYRLCFQDDESLDGDQDSWSRGDFLGVVVNPFKGVSGAAVDPVIFFFQWSFAATASTIDSGALAERVNFVAYLTLSTFISSIVYPIVAHWGWGGGWLTQMGFIDFAGGMIVHGVGGTSALMTTMFVGPRIGRFPYYHDHKHWLVRRLLRKRYNSNYYRRPTAPHERAFWVDLNPIGSASNPVQLLFGTMMLWIGWYGFNPGSTFAVTSNQDSRAALVALNTTLAACCGGMVGLCWSVAKLRVLQFECGDLCNGVLCGLVGITAPCCCVDTIGACSIGIVIPIVGFLAAKVVETIHVDDVVAAISVHGVCGMMGCIAVGFLGNPDCVTGDDNTPHGVLYGGSVKQLTVQIIGCAAIVVFTMGSTLFALHIIDRIVYMRAHRFEELVGLDYCEHNFCENPSQRVHYQKTLEVLRTKMEEDSASFESDDGDVRDDDMGDSRTGLQAQSTTGGRALIVKPEDAAYVTRKDQTTPQKSKSGVPGHSLHSHRNKSPGASSTTTGIASSVSLASSDATEDQLVGPVNFQLADDGLPPVDEVEKDDLGDHTGSTIDGNGGVGSLKSCASFADDEPGPGERPSMLGLKRQATGFLQPSRLPPSDSELEDDDERPLPDVPANKTSPTGEAPPVVNLGEDLRRAASADDAQQGDGETTSANGTEEAFDEESDSEELVLQF